MVLEESSFGEELVPEEGSEGSHQRDKPKSKRTGTTSSTTKRSVFWPSFSKDDAFALYFTATLAGGRRVG